MCFITAVLWTFFQLLNHSWKTKHTSASKNITTMTTIRPRPQSKHGGAVQVCGIIQHSLQVTSWSSLLGENEFVICFECSSRAYTVCAAASDKLLLGGHLVINSNSVRKQRFNIVAKQRHISCHSLIVSIGQKAADRSDVPFKLDRVVRFLNKRLPWFFAHSGMKKSIRQSIFVFWVRKPCFGVC